MSEYRDPAIRPRLAIVTQDPENYGGVLRLVEYIFARALAAGFEPTLVHYGRYAAHPELHASLSNLVRGELNLWPRSKRYTFRGMPAIAIGAWLPEWEPNRFRASRVWRKALADFEAYILVTGSAHTGLPLAQFDKPFVVWVSSTVMDDRGERLRSSNSISTLTERLGMLSVLKAEVFVLGAADRVLAVSEDAASHLDRLAAEPVEVWPFPVDTDLFVPAPMPRSERARFLFVGRANDPRKRVNLFLEACDILRDEHSLGFEAIVVSSQAWEGYDPTGSVELRSGVTDAELVSLYQSATALVMTSEQEGLGIAAMEAMACGTPVISTRSGGPEQFIEDNLSGIFVNDRPDEVAERMLLLASDPALRERMGSSARLRIEQAFSQHVWNSKFESLINHLI